MSDILLGAVLALVIGAAAAGIAVAVLRARPRPAEEPDAALLEVANRQAEIAGGLHAMGQMLAGRQADLERAMHERLDSVSHHLKQSMTATQQNTSEHLSKLNERLAVIDSAQKNITDLATQMGSLTSILSNKQSRGAFGQTQLEAIIADALPKGAYEFQFTLPNKTRPDCVIFMPDAGPLIIDAKFPLEAMTALRNASTEDERKLATQRVKQDITKHISDIAQRYLIPGETQDIALMFIPSESVYADLYERFDDIIQRSHRARVMIVSPTLMVLAIQVIRQIRKDAQMREAADQIRTEVGHMMKDVRLLGERVRKLQNHLGQTTDDMNSILTSTGRIERRAGRIEELDFDGEADSGGANVIPAPMARRLGAAE